LFSKEMLPEEQRVHSRAKRRKERLLRVI